MSAIEYLELLTTYAKGYRLDAGASLGRNSHMHQFSGAALSQDDVDAILTDFINYCGNRNGIDYALYAEDLAKEPRTEKP